MGQLGVVLLGLVVAACGQLLLREVPSAVATWARMDSVFPSGLRSSPTAGGYALLAVGGVVALQPLLA